MTQNERIGIMRIVSDLIKADAIIDTREIEFLNSIRKKYGVKKEDERLASKCTLEEAFSILLKSSDGLRKNLTDDFIEVAMSDEICAREEALLLLAIRCCLLGEIDVNTRLLSIDTSELYIEPSQVLYVESEYDENVNKEILDSFRELTTEMRLAGFDFVYLPKVAERYRLISEKDLFNIAGFLYPMVGEERLNNIINKVQHITTEEFCKDQLAAKLGVNVFSVVMPSMMIKVGTSFVDNKRISNFLLIELEENVLDTIRKLLDLFSLHFRTYRLNYLVEEHGRFIYSGFYKQIFDIYMLRKGIKSRVVIDVYRNEIRLPDADAVISKLHRREKALYALFLVESASGGINFSKPESPKFLAKYERRMAAIQKKYSIIYKKFGGEPEKAPNLAVPETRLPMFALIKKQIKSLGGVLFNVDDYTIRKNIYGNYAVSIAPSLCCACGINISDVFELAESEEWKLISAL